MSYSVRHFGKRIHDLTEESQARLADLSTRVQESMAGIRVVKAFVQEDYEIDQFERMNQSLLSKNRELIVSTSIFYPTMQLFIGFAVVVGPLLTEQRRVFASKGIWIGGPIALLIFLPNLIWKLQHNGPLVELMRNIRASGRDIEVGAFGLPRAPDLPGDSGDISGLADGSVLFSFRTRGPRISGLGWAFMAVLATLVVLHGKDYYATPVYPMVFAGDGCGNRRGSADLRSG